MLTTLLRFGLAAGAVLSLLMFAPYFIFGARPEWMRIGEIVGYTSMLLCLSATFFAMRRENARRGPLRYGSALAVGVGVSAVAGLMFGIATWGFYAVAGDALPEALIAFYRLQIESSGAGAEQIAQQVQELEAMKSMFYNRPLQAGVMAATVFVIGVLQSLIWAALVARGARRAAA